VPVFKDFALPDLGEGLTESELVLWHVEVGDVVELNQIIADVETAKALVELPAPYAGVIARLHVEPGVTVAVGEPLVTFEVDGGIPSAPDPRVSAQDALAQDARTGDVRAGDVLAQDTLAQDTLAQDTLAQGTLAQGTLAGDAGAEGPQDQGNAEEPRQPNLVGYGAAPEKSGRPVRRPRHVPAAAAAGPTVDALSAGPVDAARDAAPDAGTVAGTVAGTDAGTRARTTARETRIPIKGVRKATADAMVASAFSAPHASAFLSVDVTPTIEFLDRLSDSEHFAGYRFTFLTAVAKAVSIVFSQTPSINSHWDGGAGEIVQFGYLNLGIAVATPRGLIVPVIRDADGLSLSELAIAMSELVDTARAGRTGPGQLSGGTFSISNVGVFGIDAGIPIINPGEAAILAVGAVRSRPWEHNGEIALRKVVTLSVSFDHRIVDGEDAARFLTAVGGILADPILSLTMM
jgi:2-oxoisovalerate dehydrogenase E2 component (dihydrolipoyl transacylase)